MQSGDATSEADVEEEEEDNDEEGTTAGRKSAMFPRCRSP